jgi:hypothetical protein
MCPEIPQIPDNPISASEQGTPNFNPAVPTAMFGGPVAQGLDDVGGAAAHEALRLQALQNETDATNLSTDYMAKLGTLKGQFMGLKGEQWQAAAPQYQQKLMDLRDQYIGMASNPDMKEMITKDVALQTDRSLLELGTKTGEETTTASIQASTSRATQVVNNAIGVRNDPNQVQEYLARGVSELQKTGELLGWDKDTLGVKTSQYVGNAYEKIIGSLATENPTAAGDMFTQNRGMMDAESQLRISQSLLPKLTNNTLKMGVDKVFGSSATIYDAISGQESGGNAAIGSSVDGAVGKFQIIPATFAQYAKPGEDIRNPADNEAVGHRIIDDLMSKTGGDVARTAVGYFSGPGNIAPAGSPTPYLNDRADGNGKTVSSYVQDVVQRAANLTHANSAQFPDLDG